MLDFHHITAHLMFMSTQARRDIQNTLSFLTTRVKTPDRDDWGKLKQLLRYLHDTRGLNLTLEMESLMIVKCFMDVSHNTYWDCKGRGEGGKECHLVKTRHQAILASSREIQRT